MKKTFVFTTCVITLIAAGAVAFSVHYARQTTRLRIQCSQWQMESRTNMAKLADYANIAESNRQVMAALEKNASDLNGTLADYKDQLASANDKIQAYALAEQNRQKEEREKYLASVPRPALIERVYVFPKVVGVHDEILATNAAFAYITGRRLVFRPGNQVSVVVDVDNIHPLILQYLGIDANNAKLNQQLIDAQNAAERRNGAILTAQFEKDQQAKREREAALAIEQEKADAAQRAAWAAQQQAAVDKAKVDALINSALNPPQINVIQQSQQRTVVY